MKHVIARLRVLPYGLAVGIWFAAGSSAIAQEPGPPPPDDMEPPPASLQPKMNVDKEISKIAKRYALSNDQKAQIRAVLTDEKQKMDAVFQDSSLKPEELFSKMKTIHDDEVSRVTAILTADQRAKYEKDQRQMVAHQGDDGPNGRTAASAARRSRWRATASARELSIGASFEETDCDLLALYHQNLLRGPTRR